MTIRAAILAAHRAKDTRRRALLMREAIRRGATHRDLAALVAVSTSTVHGWVGPRELIIGDPLNVSVEELGLGS